MNVRDLDIDLIDRINPFGEAYAILAKTMSEESLKRVAAVISAKKVNLTPEEARDLAKACPEIQAGARTSAVNYLDGCLGKAYGRRRRIPCPHES